MEDMARCTGMARWWLLGMVMASAGAAQPWSKEPIGVVGGWGKKADVDEQLNNLPPVH